MSGAGNPHGLTTPESEIPQSLNRKNPGSDECADETNNRDERRPGLQIQATRLTIPVMTFVKNKSRSTKRLMFLCADKF